MNTTSQMIASSALYVAFRGLAAASVHLEARDTPAAVTALRAVVEEASRALTALDPSGVRDGVPVPALRPSTR